MTEWAAKRFWTDVTVAKTEDGYQVLLDGRPVRTPQKAPLHLPTAAYADLVAEEWRAVDKVIDPGAMPVTRAANSSLDKIIPQRADVIEMLTAYGASDLLCYRAPSPQGLIDRQAAAWDPWLDWADQRHGARLVVTTGVLPVDQDAAAVAKLEGELQRMSAFELAGAHDLITISGSLVLALAVCDGALDPDTAWNLARIDEEWQIEQWGRDEEADSLAAIKRQDFLRAHLIFTASSA